MRTKINLLPVLCLLLLCSCKIGNASGKNTNKAEQEASRAGQDTITGFILPTIPAMMTAPEQRADFVVKHYWNNVNFADTNYIHHPEITEQAWADYCDLLNHVPLATAQEAMRKTIEQTYVEKKMFVYITGLADKYLYNPNSPMRNEEFYIPVLDAMIAAPILEDTEKVRPQARRELAQRNRIGTKAIDFTYTLASGKQGTLYGNRSAYTLLFINNPGCHACAETTRALKEAPIIGRLVQSGQLTVLSLYPDEEVDEWRRHLSDFPREWVNGYDKELTIQTKQLYDLQAIPTLYLMDRDKTVLLKDAAAEAIEEYLLLHVQ